MILLDGHKACVVHFQSMLSVDLLVGAASASVTLREPPVPAAVLVAVPALCPFFRIVRALDDVSINDPVDAQIE